MKRYFVVVQNTATDKNELHRGEVCRWTYGKGEQLVARQANYDTGFNFNHTTYKPYAMEYGYKREQDARRNPSYKDTQSSEMWDREVAIIEVNV